MRHLLFLFLVFAALPASALTPPIITADQNNYNPNGFELDMHLLLQSDAPRTITGLARPIPMLAEHFAMIINIGLFNITLAKESLLSYDSLRFQVNADFIIRPGQGILLNYDTDIKRWLAPRAAFGEIVVGPIALEDMLPFVDVSNALAVREVTVEDMFGLYDGDFLKSKRFSFFSDFINTVGETTDGGGLVDVSSALGSTESEVVTAGNIVGVVRSKTGAGASGRAAVVTAPAAVRLGGGAWAYEVSLNPAALSTGAQQYEVLAGFFDDPAADNQTDGAYILYDSGGSSTGSASAAYWQTVTASNATRTFSPALTQVTVAAGAWTKLRIEVNAAGTQALFYVNGLLVSTHTTNIPVAAGRETGFGWSIIKSNGALSRTLDVDYIMAQCKYTVPK